MLQLEDFTHPRPHEHQGEYCNNSVEPWLQEIKLL